MPKRFGFPKAERLKSQKQIDELFAGGKSVSAFPVRAVYAFAPAAEGKLQVGVSVSKRHFKRAVDRNRIKRLLREAYRLQKEEAVLRVREAGVEGRVFFLYTDKALADFETVKKAVASCLLRLGKHIKPERAS